MRSGQVGSDSGLISSGLSRVGVYLLKKNIYARRVRVRSDSARFRSGILGPEKTSSPKSSFQIKVNFAFHLEIKVWSPEEEWRGTDSKLLEVQCEVSEVSDDLAAVTSAGVGPLCFIKSKVNAAIYQEILEHFMLPSADKLYGDADFLFQQDFSTCPQCQNHFQVLCWPWYYCAWLASQHAWPEPHMESMGYFQEKDEKQSIQQSTQ